MNDLIFAILILALLYYFFYYLPRQKSLNQSTQPSTHSISTQTNLSDKQITLLTNQWNQVALWAQEVGIDTNKSWNLTLLKNKIKQELEIAKKPPLKVQYSRTTQTDNPDSDLENTLDNLLQSIKDLNNQIK